MLHKQIIVSTVSQSESKQPTYKMLSEALNIYISSIGESPAQRTQEWYDIRKFTIGGSEVATVLGLNPFESVKSLVAKKVSLGYNFTGNTATRWGNLFEVVTQQFTEKLLKMHMPISSAGSIKGVVEGQRYSPDGLGVVRLLRTDDIKDNFIVLFEFKSPLRSLPLGTIPKHYIPQVQTGLLSISIAEFAIFVNCCYRKCSLADLSFNNVYDLDFHDGDSKKRKLGLTDKLPYAYGVCCFYQTSTMYNTVAQALGYLHTDQTDNWDHLYSSNSDSVYKDIDGEILLTNDLIDFGAKKSPIDRLLQLIDEKKVLVKYLPMVLNSDIVNDMKFTVVHHIKHRSSSIDYSLCIKEFTTDCLANNLVPIGYLPWKLMAADVLIEHRVDNWLEKIQEPIMSTIETIKQIALSADPLDAYQKKYNINQDIGDYSDML